MNAVEMLLYEGQEEKEIAKLRFMLYVPPKGDKRGKRGIRSTEAQDILRQVESERLEWSV